MFEFVYKRYNVVSPKQVFNIDETGFSVRDSLKSKQKAVFKKFSKSNVKDLQGKSNSYRINMMPVVRGNGKAYNPVVILPGNDHKYRKCANEVTETVHKYMPPDSYVSHRQIAGVDTNIFNQWAIQFIIETKP